MRTLTLTLLLAASAFIVSSVTPASVMNLWFTQEARLGSPAPNNEFSSAVAISGDTALVAANEGIYVFVRDDGTWTQQTVLAPSDGMTT